MFARAAILVALLLPGVAQAQFSLAVTQIGNGQEGDFPTYQGICAAGACRATIPARVGGDLCVLNVYLGAPSANGLGRILFSVGPCRSGLRLASSPVSAGYVVDRLGATSQTFQVHFQPAEWARNAGEMNDAVVHEMATLRLDIIATKSK